MSHKGLLIFASLLFLMPASIRAQTKEDKNWLELVKRCNMYRVPSEGNVTTDSVQWSDDVKLLGIYAKAGKEEAYHELFLMTLYSDGGLTDEIADQLLKVRKKNTKLFDRLLKKESKKVQEEVASHLEIAAEGYEPT